MTSPKVGMQTAFHISGISRVVRGPYCIANSNAEVRLKLPSCPSKSLVLANLGGCN